MPRHLTRPVFINTPITADSAGQHLLRFPVSGDGARSAEHDPERLRAHRPEWQRQLCAGRNGGRRMRTSPATPTTRLPPSATTKARFMWSRNPRAQNSYGYLLGLNSTTLATKYKVFLKDPRNSTPTTPAFWTTARPHPRSRPMATSISESWATRQRLARIPAALQRRSHGGEDAGRFWLGLHRRDRAGEHGPALYRHVVIPDFREVQQLRWSATATA